MRKKSLLAYGALTLSLLFTGCEKGIESKKEPTPIDTANETETEKDFEITITDGVTNDDIPLDKLVEKVELCDYSKLTTDAKQEEVSEEKINTEMKNFIANYDKYEEVKEGVVKDGDTVNIDYIGKIDGKEFEGGSAEGYDLKIGSNSFIEGFEAQLVNAKVGESVEVKCKFPDDYHGKEVAGKDAVFTVKVNHIQGEKIPGELTDDFLKANTEYKTVAELKESISTYLKTTAKNNYDTEVDNDMLDFLMENSKFPDVPKARLVEYANNMVKYYKEYAAMYQVEYTDFISSYMGTTEEEFNKQIEQSAMNYVKSNLVLKAIAAKENITLTDEEFDKYLEEYAKNNGYESKDNLKTALEENGDMEMFKNESLYTKVLARLRKNIK